MESDGRVSVNANASRLVKRLADDAAALRIDVAAGKGGETLIDAGGRVRGGVEAGLRLAEICMGGLGRVALVPDARLPRWPWRVAVSTSQPVTACLASQYAGWSLNHGEGKGSYFALGSGPARALARKEPLFEELAYRDPDRSSATLVIEADEPPPDAVLQMVAETCAVEREALNVIFAPTSSLAGGVQVVARVVEVALHKAHALHFPLDRILDAAGSAPLPPPHPDFVQAMGRTNDAIIYGGEVHLFVAGPADAAQDLADRLPSIGSRDYGRPFATVFKEFDQDFYKVDAMLFSPASVIVTAVETGETFRGGALAPDLVDASFG